MNVTFVTNRDPSSEVLISSLPISFKESSIKLGISPIVEILSSVILRLSKLEEVNKGKIYWFILPLLKEFSSLTIYLQKL